MICTVIVPAYRASRYIEHTLQSLLSQNVTEGDELRITVVCDGCEESFESCRAFASEQVSVVLTEENAGVYGAINLGVKLSRLDSALIGACGADDLWHPDRLRKTLALERSKSEGLRCYGCMHSEINEDGALIGEAGRVNSGQFLYSSGVFKRIGLFRPWRCGADTEFIQRARSNGVRRIYLKENLFSYRRHPSQLTADPRTGFGSPERERYAQEIDRLRSLGMRGSFVNPPTPKIKDRCGQVSPREETFAAFFEKLPLNASPL